jgi:large subunit ribosomal protein L20
MTRIKRGVTSNRRHKKLLELAKGYRMSKHRLIKVATEAVLHAGEYAFAGRKHRKRQMRRLWIVRINAVLATLSLKYSQFIHLLKLKQVEVDRKIMAVMAQDTDLFTAFVKKVQEEK